MNVASLENCKELYELSCWQDDMVRDKYASDGRLMIGPFRGNLRGKEVPAYDLSCLLRKLPREVDGLGLIMDLGYMRGEDVIRFAYGKRDKYLRADEEIYSGIADTPEDALALLAIELFKQGVIK